MISIHAPARGATTYKLDHISNHGISIHAPARGATIQKQNKHLKLKFQSTLPRGERRVHSSVCCYIPADFNPRSREGSDLVYGASPLLLFLFQSTLPRGERREVNNEQTKRNTNFNPRSREGSDPVEIIDYTYIYISIHAPARGATTNTRSN